MIWLLVFFGSIWDGYLILDFLKNNVGKVGRGFRVFWLFLVFCWVIGVFKLEIRSSKVLWEMIKYFLGRVIRELIGFRVLEKEVSLGIYIGLVSWSIFGSFWCYFSFFLLDFVKGYIKEFVAFGLIFFIYRMYILFLLECKIIV